MRTPQSAIRPGTKAPTLLYPAAALLSASSLGLEIVLMRLFSIVQWHHYASMVISLSLLGIGAGGIFVRLFRDALVERFVPVFTLLCLLFGASAAGCFTAARAFSFNPLQFMWSPGQWIGLACTYTVLAVPFFCFGAGISLAMTARPESINRIYAYDLAGAGLGAAAAALALTGFLPEDCLRAAAGGGFLAAGLAAAQNRDLRLWGALLAAAAICLTFVLPQAWTRPAPSEYKDLARAKIRPEAEILLRKPSLHGVVTAVSSPRVPFRFAPGLSPLCEHEPQKQVMVFLNGDQYGALPGSGAGPSDASFLRCLPTHAAYLLLDSPTVLKGSALRGLGVFEPAAHRVASLEALERNRTLLELLQTPFTAEPERTAPLSLRQGSLRSHLARTGRRYDLIQLFAPCSGAAGLGAQGIAENYTCTVQGIAAVYESLRPDGLLMLTHRLAHPPSGAFKLVATVRAALEKQGTADAAKRIALIASPTTSTILVKNGVLTGPETERIRKFCSERAFELIHPASGGEGGSLLQRGVRALLGKDPETFLEGYKYHIRPATDASPYFSRFFKWSSLPELLELRGRGGAPLIQWGYLIMAATVLQAAAAGALLILLPLFVLHRSGSSWPHKGRAVLAFTFLGLGFLFVEIAFIQRLTLFLGDPILAASVVLASFLVFAGAGSWWSRIFGLGRAVTGVCTANLLLLAGLLIPVQALVALDWPLKLPLAVAGCGLPAFFMGMPLPLALDAVNRLAPRWVPWAWGVNGCASVLAPVLATLLAVHLGFAALVLLACALYAGLYFTLRTMPGTGSPGISGGEPGPG
jgi:MFS family permease